MGVVNIKNTLAQSSERLLTGLQMYDLPGIPLLGGLTPYFGTNGCDRHVSLQRGTLFPHVSRSPSSSHLVLSSPKDHGHYCP